MSDPASRLPTRPSLEQLRKQAKELLQLHRAGDAGVTQRFRAALPRLAANAASTAVLADAQFVVAREYGFRSWAELARHVETINPSDPGGEQVPPIRPVELLAPRSIELPDGGTVPADTVWDMFTATRNGDLDRVKALVARHPGLARYEYNYTPPIYFAVREGHADIVRYLLDLGADPTMRSYPFQDSLVTIADDRDRHDVARVLREHLSRRFALSDEVTAILEAARSGDVPRVNAELARNHKLARASNETGDTPLHRAADAGHLQVVDVLLAAGANVDAVRGDGYRPIHCALMPRRGQTTPEERARVFDTLIAHGAEYTIFIAAVRGDMPYVRAALARDASLANFEDTCHQRPISAAAHRNDVEMVKLLLDHGADPNLPEEASPRGHALWDAVYYGYRELTHLLVAHGADPNAMVESSGTPMGHARKDPELFQLLRAHGGDDQPSDKARLERLIDDGDLAGVEALLRANPDLVRNGTAYWSEGIMAGPANGGTREMLELLMKYGATVPPISKWAPYYYFKRVEIAAFLLDRGMDPNHMSWHRVTLLHHVATEGDLTKMRLLLDHGATIDAIDDEYRSTPLGMASRWGRRDAVALLLERGADPNAAGAPWATPLAWAQKKGHVEIEADLRRAGAV
jgi:ankyrin repeat protein